MYLPHIIYPKLCGVDTRILKIRYIGAEIWAKQKFKIKVFICTPFTWQGGGMFWLSSTELSGANNHVLIIHKIYHHQEQIIGWKVSYRKWNAIEFHKERFDVWFVLKFVFDSPFNHMPILGPEIAFKHFKSNVQGNILPHKYLISHMSLKVHKP